MQSIRFDGRVLFLSADAGVVRRQLQGEELDRATAGLLRDDVSTDEITPLPSLVHFDDEIGRHAHTGYRAGESNPIPLDGLRLGGFGVLVAGRRYGKGSSREHAPLAERAAGIRLVIAESFERIYRQNCDNIGLFTSTDFGLLDRIRAGEAIPLADLLQGRDELAARILAGGGLLEYGRAHLFAAKPAPLPDGTGPQTLTQKIIARHLLSEPGRRWAAEPGSGGFVKARFRFIHEIYTAMAAHMLHRCYGRPLALHEPDTILCFEDHNAYAHRSPTHQRQNLLPAIRRLSEGHRAFSRDYGLKDHGYLVGEDGSEGISHALMAETYAVPGEICVGTDSHTPHSGALGCLAFGVGTTDMANAFMTGAVRLTVPESLLIRLEGSLPAGITAKDVVLKLLAEPRIRAGLGLGRVFEFAGPVVSAMSIDERATLTNMTAELGGFSGIVAPDAETARFIRERRQVDVVIEDWMASDPGAPYAAELTLDCSALTPMLAAPGDPGNGVPCDGLAAPVPIGIAYGGSCTAGKREDFDQYHEVLAWAAARGLKVPDNVTFYLQFGTVAVRRYCEERGYLDTFRRVGAQILNPACGACAQCGPGVSSQAEEMTISAINRNFPGRSGPGKVWLASPPTVAASAIAGEIVSFGQLQRRTSDLRGQVTRRTNG
ncbi:3-isopropylmalate dehydratase [Bosea sp. SSUT16]|jgi:3-isopropylmalate/(R)-2-methylmalate dehydratase large subunit|uniref:3-isopropylmalate dehydratase n=1 Tax=Bosea spartocytisi TaxID=2773451 RepID=A0A927EFV9_9HYPH|nr:aconitase family protein [Bosea spartocytisi]MBD3848584.1 3-isopropylmalate dehydratase [Bosea spartocytisi]MCT4475032.1 aconitase family protein [Bosea spartocytisi]